MPDSRLATRRLDAVYVCYADLDEPLVHSQVLPYLRELGRRGLGVTLLTFESRVHTPDERAALAEGLAEQGVAWTSLRYHRRPYLAAKLLDIMVGSWTVGRLVRRRQAKVIHARSHVAAAMALAASAFGGCKHIFDMRGLLAEEFVDAGHWRQGSLVFRLTKLVERLLFRRADAIVMLTTAIRGRLLAVEPTLRGREADVHVIPCCVDTQVFREDSAARERWRRARGWEGRRVLAYVGKIGSWYLHRQMAAFFAELVRQEPAAIFAAYSPSDPAPLRDALSSLGVDPARCEFARLQPDQVPAALAAADAGISFIQPSYSKMASSPTKLGEYLAAGLPVVVNAGVGDTDALVRGNSVGVVLEAFAEADYRRAVSELLPMLGSDEARRRSRATAERELSLEAVGGPRYASVYGRLLPGFGGA